MANRATQHTLLAAAMVLATATAGAQVANSVSLGAEFGGRSYLTKLDPLSIGKFEEYRDMKAWDNTSPLLEQLLVRFTPADSIGTYALSARKLGDRDRSVYLHAARAGEFDFQIRMDGITHTYSTTAHSPGNELSTPGFNTLPIPRPDSLAWRNGAWVGAIRNQWDPVRATLVLNPTRDLDTKLDFTYITKKGGMPRSISFSGSSGPQREFVSPVDQNVSNFLVSQGASTGDRAKATTFSFIRSAQVNVSYAYSKFANNIKSVMVDDPQQSVSTTANGVAASRVSLEPDNTAQTIAANAAVLLPMRTRISAAASTSRTTQNDPFFPQTSNDTLLAHDPNARLLSLSRGSLGGGVDRSTWFVSMSSHPIDEITVTAKARSFDYWTHVSPFTISAMAVSDRNIATADVESYTALPFTKRNTDLGATWLATRGLAVSAGYSWDGMARDPSVRNLAKTDETSPRVSVDWTGNDLFSLRASYTTGTRRGSTYTISGTEIDGFRRPDEADRDRVRAMVIGTVNPIDELALSLTVQAGHDNYPSTQYGVVRDQSVMGGVDVDYSPSDRWTVSAGYTLENVKDSAFYRYRTGSATSLTYNNPTFQYANTNTDRNVTMYLLFNATLIPDKLTMNASWSANESRWWMYNRNPVAPSCPTPGAGQTACTAANLLNATAQDWPMISQRAEPFALGFSYRYSPEWALTLRYQYERYTQNDFRTLAPVFTTDGLNGSPVVSNYAPGELPGTIGQTAGTNTGQYHFLGNNFRPYSTDWLTFTVSYQPSLLKWARGRSTF